MSASRAEELAVRAHRHGYLLARQDDGPLGLDAPKFVLVGRRGTQRIAAGRLSDVARLLDALDRQKGRAA